MTYNILREAYLKARTNLTILLSNSEKLGLGDGRISYLVDKEGLYGKRIFSLLSNISKIQKKEQSILLNQKRMEMDKSMVISPLLILMQDIQQIQEVLSVANGCIDKKVINTVNSCYNSLNKVYTILKSRELEEILEKIK